MEQISCFRGMAGEVVRDFVRPASLSSALPLVVLIFLLRGLSRWESTGHAIAVVVFYAAFLSAAARFALSAREGGTAPSIDVPEILSLTGRALLASLPFLLPLLTVTIYALKKRPAGGFGTQGLAPLPFAPPSSVLEAACFLLWCLLPPLALLLATRFGDMGAIFSRDSWRWLGEERRDDVATFFALLFGGTLINVILYLLPLWCLSAVWTRVSPGTSGTVITFLSLLPVTAGAKLIGKLCGIFVASERLAEVKRAGKTFTPSIVGASVAPPVVTVDALAEETITREPKPDVVDVWKRVETLASEDLPAVREQAEEGIRTGDRPLFHTIEVALVERKEGRGEAAVRRASAAIDLAAQRGFGDVAVGVFRLFLKERSALSITPYSLELLGNILLNNGMFLDAAWCYHTGSAGGDSLKAQKKLLHVAQEAEKAGKKQEAATLYDFFIRTYPAGNLTSFAREGRERLNR